MNSRNNYISFDSTEIEIMYAKASSQTGCLVIWPCTGGAYQMYHLPVEKFLHHGISVIQFNPRGHGGSAGQMDYGKSIKDLLLFLKEHHDDTIPLTFMGHSGGAGALLAAGSIYGKADKYILVSPVLDSRESLEYMYRLGTIMEFNNLLAEYASDRESVLKILENPQWMDTDLWQSKGYRSYLDGLSGDMLIGTFLEHLFINGFNAYDDLINFSDRTRILIAEDDNWYPLERTVNMARENSIPVSTVSGANDHYFTEAWGNVWEIVFDDLRCLN